MTVRELYTAIDTLRRIHPFDIDKARITWVYDPAAYYMYDQIVIKITEGPTEIKLYHTIKKQEAEICKP
jgi:hypothetical protein